MKTYEVLISEEVAYKYRVKAKNSKLASIKAMDKHINDIEPANIKSVDRCEVINCEEINERGFKK